MRGNRIEKGPQADNHAGFIAIGAEGVTHAETEIRIENNVAVFDGIYPTSFLRNLTGVAAQLVGNSIPAGVVPLQGPGEVSAISSSDTVDAKH